MNKKLKTILFTSGTLATVATIIPVIVIASSINQKSLKTSSEVVDRNVNNLDKLSINANPELTQSASDVAKFFTSNKNNFSSLSSYFNTYQIESLATANSATATYLLETQNINDNSTSLIFHIIINSTINHVVTSKTTDVTINNFPNATEAIQNTNKNILNQLNTNLTALKINTIVPTLSSTQVIDALTKLSSSESLTLDDFNTYFNTNSIAAIISKANNITPIKIGYFVNPISSNNLEDGTISISLTCLNGSESVETTKIITLNIYGFISNNQIAINNYVNAINSATNIIGKNTISPSMLNALNINQYLNNMPKLPNDLTQLFTLSNLNNINGSISLSITVSGVNAISVTTNTIIVGGFESNNQILINQYISSLNSITNVSGDNTILPSTLVNTTVSLFINTIPISPHGIELTYAISNSNNITGTINLVITASAPNATSVDSKTFLISGFLTNKEVNSNRLNTLIKTIESNKYVANNSSITIAPQTIADTLRQISNLNLNDLNTYFDVSSISNALTNTLGSNISSISISPILNTNITNGTISFNILFSVGQANIADTQNVTITVSGFLTAAQSTTQTANIAALQSFIKLISANPFKANPTSSTNTSQEIYTALTTQGTLTLNILNKYFDTSIITNALNASPDISVTNIIPLALSSTAQSSGVISIYLKFAIDSGVTQSSTVDIITIAGFSPIKTTS